MATDTLEKAPDAYRTISEVAEDLDLPQHVLRFWETRFSQIRPLKRGGGRRYYRPDDVALIKGVRALLYGQGYTIKGVQRILKDQGPKPVQALGRDGGAFIPPPAGPQAPPAHERAAAPMFDEAERSADPPAPPARTVANISVAPPAEGSPPPPVAPSAHAPLISPDMRARLEAALAELGECRRIIGVARAA
jgi:DNA-binding transcriptional MerR regulator